MIIILWLDSYTNISDWFSIKSMYYFYVNVIMFYKQARKLFIATIIGSLMDIILAYLLVPRFGMYGSAIAFVLAR